MSLLDQLELEIKERIEAFPFFQNLTVLSDPQKNVIDEISVKIAKIRTLVAPFVNRADDRNPNTHGSYFDLIQFNVGVFQNPLIASSNNDPTPRTICEQVHAVLKNWKPDSLSNVVVARVPGIEPVEHPSLNIWNAAFETKGGEIATLPTVATPVINLVSTPGSVVITCATAGAAIFYTINNAAPWPTTNLYTAPFAAPAAGTRIKARAYLAGKLNSAIATATV